MHTLFKMILNIYDFGKHFKVSRISRLPGGQGPLLNFLLHQVIRRSCSAWPCVTEGLIISSPLTLRRGYSRVAKSFVLELIFKLLFRICGQLSGEIRAKKTGPSWDTAIYRYFIGLREMHATS